MKQRQRDSEVGARARRLLLIAFFVLATLAWQPGGKALAAPEQVVPAKTRCAVCGMFVAKYPNWASQVRLTDERVLFFDGVKDMMVFVLHPDRYRTSAEAIQEIWVRDYYRQEWIDAGSAWYVVGSDVMGPMGKELVPFASKEAARTFLEDHHGSRILPFAEISADLIQSLRTGMRMKHGRGK